MELAGAVTYIIDGIITSRFLGSTALAASGMTGICFTILAIISGAVLLLVGMFFEEKDLSAIKRTVRISLQYIELLIGGLAVVYFLAAPWLALLYLPASSPSYSLAVLILRCHAISLPFLAFNEFYICLVQGTGNLRAAHLVTLLNKLIYIVLLSFLLETFYGVYGLWISIPLSKVLLCLSIYLVNGIKNRKNQLPETIQKLEAFCTQQKLDAHQSYHIQLFFEELILLIIDHGFQEKKNPSIDVRIVKETDGIILRVKDNCRTIPLSFIYFRIRKTHSEMNHCRL